MAAEDKTIILITGSSQGLGYHTAQLLLLSSASNHIILTGRSPSSTASASASLQSTPGILGTVSTLTLDVTSDPTVDAAAAEVEATFGRLDTLVNNAGIISTANPPSREAFRNVLNTNVVGALSVTEAFLPLLRKAKKPRMVFVSSSVGSISQAADPESKYHSSNAFEYRSSKAAVNMLIVLYWNRLKGDGVKVLGADPGLCATNFTGNSKALLERGAAGPEVGAERIARVVRGEVDEWVGRVVGEYGVSPW